MNAFARERLPRAAASVALALLLGACAASDPGLPTGAVAAPSASVSPAPTTTIAATVRVTESRYGAVVAETVAATPCSLEVIVPQSEYGARPPRLVSATADATGVVRWSYPAPRGAAGTGEHRIACATEGGIARGVERFEVSGPQIDARRFAVRVIASSLPASAQELGREIPSLVPLRDATVAAAIRTLPAEWRLATRGLGELSLVDHSEDILVSVVAGKGTSVHVRSGRDQTQEIVVFVEGNIGAESPENAVAVMLHELGHIWCCSGAGTVDGHWAEQQVSPGLAGLDKYGLMNHPIECLTFTGFTSCPNRFSDRELNAMGFRELPPPPVDACVARKSALQTEIPQVRAGAAALARRLETDAATLSSLRSQIEAIERQYPAGVPSAIYGSYSAMIERHNSLLAAYRAGYAEYDALVDRGTALVRESNALPCTL